MIDLKFGEVSSYLEKKVDFKSLIKEYREINFLTQQELGNIANYIFIQMKK